MKMNICKQTWLWSLTAICSLWLNGLAATASETTNEAAPETSAVEAVTNDIGTAQPDSGATGLTSTVATATNDKALEQPAAESAETVTNAAASAETEPAAKPARKGRHGQGDAIVSFGKDVELKAGETADAVVVIGGSAIVRGKVRDAAVVIGGNLDIEGEVGDAVVAVMGSVKIREQASVRGDVVSVGGTADIAEGAKVGGHVQEVNFGGIGLPKLEWLRDWLVQCVFKMRPLAPQVGWVWAVAGGFLLLYLLVALAFPRPVQVCVEELTRRPATTFLIGLLTKILLPFVLLLLLVTGIGVFFVPFLLAALAVAGIVGKVALLEYLGQQLGRQSGSTTLQKPLVAFLLGWVIITLLYMVPVLGLLIFVVTGMWALGVAVTATFGSLRRESPKPPAAPVPPAVGGWPAVPVSALAAQPGVATAPPGAESASAAGVPPPIGGSVPPAGAPAAGWVPPAAAAAVPEAWQFQRAGFWERMAAAFLDVVLVSILGALVGGAPWGFLVALAYFAGMWAWRGTTIGGIVLNLKVARLDGKPVTFLVALVRGLAAAFSVVVLFLGFLWIAWDKEKQGWHDKIAGTVVLRVPRGMPLVCV